MAEAMVGGLFAMLAWPAVGFMLIGVLVGFVVGILPGLGGFVTLALMLPFTFTMTPIKALAFLLLFAWYLVWALIPIQIVALCSRILLRGFPGGDKNK